MGRYGEARACLEESLAIGRELQDRVAITSVLQPLGMAAMAQGDLVVARGYLDEALVLAQSCGEKREVAGALNSLAMLDRVEGHPERTEPLYREAARLMREVGDRESEAISLLNLAMVSIMQGNGTAARSMILDALAAARETQSRPVMQSVLEVTAGLAAVLRDWTAAARFFGAAEAYAARTGVRRDPADEAFLAPRMELARAALGADAFASLEAQGRAAGHSEVLGEANAWLRPAGIAERAPEILRTR
jgi:tetratricopeptide (TPR) repeat protein